MYSHRSTRGPVDLAFTDRYGGVSAVPFDSLNLALEGGDDPEATAANLNRVLADFAPGAPVADLHQVHGAVVDVVDALEDGSLEGRQRPDADGVVTTRPDVVLMVRAADCVPVLLADPEAGVIGAAHSGPARSSGRCGPGDGRRDAGARRDATSPPGSGRTSAAAATRCRRRCVTRSGALVPAAVATTTWGTPALDLGAGVRAQLVALGATVVDVSRCTRESDDLYSYRRDGARAGRLAGLIRLRSSDG